MAAFWRGIREERLDTSKISLAFPTRMINCLRINKQQKVHFFFKLTSPTDKSSV